MARGECFPAERSVYRDPQSGVEVSRLTHYKGHSHHLYFTNPGGYDGGRKLLFSSDRDGRTNLYGLDLVDGSIRQLTDLAPCGPPHPLQFLTACVNPVREEAYFMHAGRLCALQLETLQERVLWELPPGYMHEMTNCTADGAQVCVVINEILADRVPRDVHTGEVDFAAMFAARPHSQLVCVPTQGGPARVAWEEDCWLGHVNTSPREADLVSFCHEGSAWEVDNRIWCMKLSEGRPWPVRPRVADEAVTHEYWLEDGESLGYHGKRVDGRHFFGRIRYDNTGCREFVTPFHTGHTYSNDLSRVVGDAGGVLRVWQEAADGETWRGPYLLCEHRCSQHIQQLHVHPQLSGDGRCVLFTSDAGGYGNLYRVELPDVETLPLLEKPEAS